MSLFSFESQAQTYIPFPDSDAMWTNTIKTYWNGQQLPSPMLIGVDYFCIGIEDTIINTVNYNKLNFCNSAYAGALRDNGGQVFYIPDGSSTELLIYDFTKAVGDTIFDVYFGGYNSGTWTSDDFVVEQIDSMLIGSNYHHIIRLENMGSEWIEGIGNTYGLFTEPYANLSGMQYELNCMSTSNTTLFPFFGTGTCSMDVGVDEIDFTQSIQVSPNPTASSFHLSSSDGKQFSYVVYNLTGHVLLTSEKEMDGFTIDLSENAPGVYLIAVTIEGQIKSLRVLKE